MKELLAYWDRREISSWDNKKMKGEITQAFLEVRKEFPFGGYMDDKLNKYITIIAQIGKEYPSGSKILSIGSGPSDLEAILSKLGYNITAIDDLNDQWHLIGKNRDRIKDFAKLMNIELIVQSAGASQIGESYFDVVLLIDIIEHLHRSPRELLNYSISSLKPSGLLLIETPNAVALFKRLQVSLGKSSQVNANFFYWNIGEYRNHVREYTRAELRQILYYHRLTAVGSKMTNIMLNTVGGRSFPRKSIIKMFKLIFGLYPNFRDTILIWGKKPKDWQPTDNSIRTFSKYYHHIEKYNLDNVPDEFLINEMS